MWWLMDKYKSECYALHHVENGLHRACSYRMKDGTVVPCFFKVIEL